jgi:hypothetical protein
MFLVTKTTIIIEFHVKTKNLPQRGKVKYLMITSDKSVDDIKSDVDENVDIKRRRQNVTTQQNKFFKSVEHIRPNLSFFFQVKNVDAISPLVDRQVV